MKKILILSTLGMYYEGITSVIYSYSSEINYKNLNFILSHMKMLMKN